MYESGLNYLYLNSGDATSSSYYEQTHKYLCSPVLTQQIPLIESGQIKPLGVDQLAHLQISPPDVYHIWTFIQDGFLEDMFWIQKEEQFDEDIVPMKHLIQVAEFQRLYNEPLELRADYDECKSVQSIKIVKVEIDNNNIFRYLKSKIVRNSKTHPKKFVLLVITISFLIALAVTLSVLSSSRQRRTPSSKSASTTTAIPPPSNLIDGMQIAIVSQTPGVPDLLLDMLQDGQTSNQKDYGCTSDGWPATSSCGGKLYISNNFTMYIWDFATESTVTLPNLLKRRRYGHSMECVNGDADLIICGGQLAMKTCELCQMKIPIPKCKLVSDMPYGRFNHSSVAVADNQILIIGGNDSLSNQSTVFRYDTKTNSWSHLSDMNEKRNGWAGASMINTDIVLVCGGENLASCEMLNLSHTSNKWEFVEPMHQIRGGVGLVRISNGLIYALGGYNKDQVLLQSVEVFDPKTKSWTYGAKMTEPMHTHTAVLLR